MPIYRIKDLLATYEDRLLRKGNKKYDNQAHLVVEKNK